MGIYIWVAVEPCFIKRKIVIKKGPFYNGPFACVCIFSHTLGQFFPLQKNQNGAKGKEKCEKSES